MTGGQLMPVKNILSSQHDQFRTIQNSALATTHHNRNLTSHKQNRNEIDSIHKESSRDNLMATTPNSIVAFSKIVHHVSPERHGDNEHL